MINTYFSENLLDMSRNILNVKNVIKHLTVDGIITNILILTKLAVRRKQELKNIFVINVEEILNLQLDGGITTDSNIKLYLQKC